MKVKVEKPVTAPSRKI